MNRHWTPTPEDCSEPVVQVTSRDRGLSLIEILIAISLIGISVVGVLASVRINTISTALSRDHARAYQWLQSSVGILESTPRVSCELGEAAVRESYQAVIREYLDVSELRPDLVETLEGASWTSDQFEILPPVKAWDGSAYWAPGERPSYCHDADGFKLQLITMQVRNPAGEIIETLQVVKHG